MKQATLKDAPAVLNINDRAMWVLGFNAALDAQKPQMGLATLANVIDCLRSEGCYVDEEGEATDRLQDLHDALSTSSVPTCACGDPKRAGWTHRPGWCNEGGPAAFEAGNAGVTPSQAMSTETARELLAEVKAELPDPRDCWLHTIVSLVTWDDQGAVAPVRAGMSWESVARLALDYAKAAIEDAAADGVAVVREQGIGDQAPMDTKGGQ